jgi:hypothetical protein
MRLCAAPFKWLLIALMVMSFAGRPWAQSLPASTQGCGGTNAAAVEHAAAAHVTAKIAVSETAAPKRDSGKADSADCVKSCAAVHDRDGISNAAATGLRPQDGRSRSVYRRCMATLP